MTDPSDPKEPSDTPPGGAEAPATADCEHCGATLEPMEWTTLGEGPAADTLYFCDEGCIAEWRDERPS